jgi:hypothetical protein
MSPDPLQHTTTRPCLRRGQPMHLSFDEDADQLTTICRCTQFEVTGLLTGRAGPRTMSRFDRQVAFRFQRAQQPIVFTRNGGDVYRELWRSPERTVRIYEVKTVAGARFYRAEILTGSSEAARVAEFATFQDAYFRCFQAAFPDAL